VSLQRRRSVVASMKIWRTRSPGAERATGSNGPRRASGQVKHTASADRGRLDPGRVRFASTPPGKGGAAGLVGRARRTLVAVNAAVPPHASLGLGRPERPEFPRPGVGPLGRNRIDSAGRVSWIGALLTDPQCDSAPLKPFSLSQAARERVCPGGAAAEAGRRSASP
jgi:hypothetical protein